jgi:hypothetical protein
MTQQEKHRWLNTILILVSIVANFALLIRSFGS